MNDATLNAFRQIHADMKAEESGERYRVEYCSTGGSFGVAFVRAKTAEEACSMVNRSELVCRWETKLTRATLA